MSQASPVSARALAGFWQELSGSARSGDDRPLAARLADAAVAWSGAKAAAVYLREKEAWVRGGDRGELAPSLELPDPCPEAAGFVGETLWIPLASEGEVHGQLALSGVSAEEAVDVAAFLGFVFGSQLAAHRLSRQVKGAEFEVRTRLLELESLYDLGLSLGGQLDLGALADEVLFRSISLTDAGKGTLVLFDDGGRMLYERSLGGDFLPRDRFASWRIPDGEAVINNEAASLPTAGERLTGCEKCRAGSISVPGRRLGFLAVADKESRDGGVLDFTPTDARLLSLFANQAAAAIETARLHRDA
ncbi:MAG: GAF domain-containing protein, partial [Acidobacteriota bacterium]|nr:GAF domain-containing protein [Acidobacteriota bacterium]